MWTQAANVGREFKRQHGDGAVREINAGAAQARFLVKRGVGRYVLRHIGNVDLQFEIAVGESAHGDGIVEVARGLTVDGDDRQGAEVTAEAKFQRRDDGGDVLRLIERCCGKMMRQVKLADDHLNVDAEVVGAAENLNDAAPRILRGRGPVGDFNVNHHAFEVVPIRVASGFIAKHAVDGS